MKKLLLSMALSVSFGAISQTIIFQDNFEAGSGNWTFSGTGDNAWVVNNSYTGFSPFVADTPNQPVGFTNSPQSNFMHIMSGAACAGLGICNASFDTGSPSNQNAALSAGLNTTGMNTVTVDFWYLCAGAAGTSYGSLEYSINGGGAWLNVANYSGVSTWTQTSVTLPAWDNQADFRIRFKWQNGGAGIDPAFAIDELTITAITGAVNDITTTNDVTPASWCFNSTEAGTVNFNATGTFTAGNVYTAELSDATGSFATPTSIGTLASTANGNLSINTTMPAGVAVGAGYRVRVVSSAPATVGTDNTANLTIQALPSVTLSPFSQVCVYATPFELNQGTPAGGDYSGSGVVFGFFNASDAGVGNHAITYTYIDGNGCENSAMQLIGVDACASLEELNDNTLVLFPNPTQNTFTVESEFAVEQLEVVDISGKTVKIFAKNTVVYDVSNLNSGTYFVRVQTANGTKTVQLIKE